MLLLYNATTKSQKRELESEKRYRSVVQDLPALICRNTPDGVIEFVNDAYCECFGKSRKELIGKDFYSLIPKEDQDTVRANLNSLNAENPINVNEHKVIDAAGDICYQRWINRAICDESGKVVMLQAFGEDITERKKYEDEIKNNEVMFRTAFNQSFQFMAITDTSGKVLQINDQIYELVGNRPEGIIGKYFWEAWWWNFEDKANIDLKSIIKKAAKGQITSDETTFYDKDGNFHYCTRNVSPVKDSSGNIVYLTIQGQDITKQKQTKDQLIESEKQTRKANDTLKERVKELNCLNEISKLSIRPDISWEAMLQETVDLIPSAWQYSEVTCGRIKVEEKEFKTSGFKKTKWGLFCDIKIGKKKVGIIEVYYLEEKPESFEGPFLKEEINLIENIVKQITLTAENILAKKELEDHKQYLEEMVEERTQELKTMVNAMSGREIRMAELKENIKSLQKQLKDAEIAPKKNNSFLE